jgi:hypothetical protein
VADDVPIVAALLAGGAEGDRWHDWLSAAGIRVVPCDRPAAVDLAESSGAVLQGIVLKHA